MDDDTLNADPFPEVGELLAALHAQGSIAVDTPELRAHLAAQLVDALLAEIDTAVQEEFITDEEAAELRELHAEGETAAFAAQLRILLPQSSERIRSILAEIGDRMTGR